MTSENQSYVWRKIVERAQKTVLTAFVDEKRLYCFKNKDGKILGRYADVEQAEAFLDGWMDCTYMAATSSPLEVLRDYVTRSTVPMDGGADRQAALRALKELQVEKAMQIPARTDEEIVAQTEELAVWLLSWCFNHQSETKAPMRTSKHPFAERSWLAACHIQEMLTATDVQSAVAEVDDGAD